MMILFTSFSTQLHFGSFWYPPVDVDFSDQKGTWKTHVFFGLGQLKAASLTFRVSRAAYLFQPFLRSLAHQGEAQFEFLTRETKIYGIAASERWMLVMEVRRPFKDI